jgi:hypothetical protein
MRWRRSDRTPEPAALFLSWASRVFLSVWELRHITLPRIDLHCRSSRTETRRQWRVLFSAVRRRPLKPASQTRTTGLRRLGKGHVNFCGSI